MLHPNCYGVDQKPSGTLFGLPAACEKCVSYPHIHCLSSKVEKLFCRCFTPITLAKWSARGLFLKASICWVLQIFCLHVLLQMFFCKCRFANALLQLSFCKCFSANVFLQMFFGKCSSANVLLQMSFCKCSSSTVVLQMFFCKCSSAKVLKLLVLLCIGDQLAPFS